MTELESKQLQIRNYISDIKTLENIIKEKRRLKEKLQKEISSKCRHEEYTEFKWEHDNGYGKQSMITGIRCVCCGKESAWGNPKGYWSYPSFD